MLLENKVAIVTGASSGIGRAIAIELAREGAAVVVNFNSGGERANAVKAEIEGAGGRAIAVQANVANPADLQRLVDEAVRAFGRLDIMVNNAGMDSRTSTLETTEEQFNEVIGVNLKGAFFGTQLAARQMISQGGGGRIINISSIHEDEPMAGNSPYTCAKGGVRMLTRQAGVELARHAITVVGVAPGAISTPINQETMTDSEDMALLKATIPMHRLGQPEEVAALVAWLASDKASYVTATTYVVDGGMLQFSTGL